VPLGKPDLDNLKLQTRHTSRKTNPFTLFRDDASQRFSDIPRMHHLASGRVLTASLIALLAMSTGAWARDPVTATITVDGQTFVRSFDDTSEALRALRAENVRSVLPTYTRNSTVSADINIRGLVINATVPPNSTAITLSSPEANFNRTFDAGTVEATRAQLGAFLRGNEDPEGLRQLIRAVVATSTVDPVAGNPSSLLGQSVIADFAAGTLLPGDDGRLGTRAAGWHASVGASLQRQSGGDFTVNLYSLPLALSYTFGQDGIEAFVQAPLTLSDTSGGTSYMGSGAFGVRIPLVVQPDLRWALTPVLRWGAAGSEELGAVGQVYGGGLTSDLRIGLGAFTLGIANGVGRYRTEPLKVGRYNVDYRLDNWAYRNGVSLSLPVSEIAGRSLDVGVSFVDTRLTGDDLAVGSWQEYGVFASLGGTLRASASYLNGERGFNGFRVGIAAGF
jgi:hypothetical protein